MREKRFVVLKRLWQYLYQFKWQLFLAIFLSFAGNGLALIGPMLSGRAIDAIEPGVGHVIFDRVFFYVGLMVLFYILSSLLTYALAVLMLSLSQKVVRKMRADVFENLLDLPVRYHDTHQTGDILSRITYDIDTISTSLSTDVVQLLTSAITVIGALGMMLYISPQLVLVFLITVPASFFLTRHLTRKVHPLFRKRSAKLGVLNGFVEEMLSGQKVIVAYHQEETRIRQFSDQNDAAVEAYYEAEYYSSIVGPNVNFINNLSLALVSVFGALLYLFGNITIGNLSSFVLYSRKFSGPINEAANIVSEFQSALTAAERVFRIIDEKPETPDLPGAHVYDAPEGEVHFESVHFGYAPEHPVIQDLTLAIDPGSLIAIVGPTGAGKTTIINLLMRFYDPDSGTLKLDGIDIRTATRRSLRANYAMVLQDSWLFHGTVYENLAYGNPKASLEAVIEAAKMAKVHHFIESLPEGYDTVLTGDGINISQGQRQLLTIARAMLLDAKMLILDEATSNVDTQTERRIQSAMRALMRDKTCFVIAHRLSTIQNADRILVVKDGAVVEQGTHRELLRADGFYAALYQAQF